MKTYRTISAKAEGLYKDKGSRFLAFAEPVNSLADVQRLLDEYRRRYHDARHCCYAYVLGADGAEWRANDDGEPSGTAGRPILGQIHSFGLTQVLVVVVRYFGGILLGTGGLIVAYKEATADALSRADIVERVVTERQELTFGYEEMDRVMRALRQRGARIINQDYTPEGRCKITAEVPL